MSHDHDHDTHSLIERQEQHIRELERRFDSLVKVVIPIGVTLLQSSDFGQLLEAILIEAKDLCRADGGTLYLRGDDDQLKFAIVRNDSLGLALGGTSGVAVPFSPLPLQDPKTGEPNRRNVATYAALTGQTVNIADAYRAEGFEFSGTLAFDSQSGYRSTSFLTVPLKNSLGRVIGVLQLINAKDAETGAVIAFDAGVEPIVESLSTLAAAALEVYVREDRLRRQIRELRIEIDEGKRERQVSEIADTDYFQDLQRRARDLRRRTPE
jgi:hypothetical protein